MHFNTYTLNVFNTVYTWRDLNRTPQMEIKYTLGESSVSCTPIYLQGLGKTKAPNSSSM